MPNSNFPKMSFPAESELVGCGPWCEPLHRIVPVARAHPDGHYFDVDDFMIMGKLHRQGRPDLILYKHIDTRRYLNLDDEGRAYRYLPPPRGSSSHGQYRRHRNLMDAIAALRLYELEWLSRRRQPANVDVDPPAFTA